MDDERMVKRNSGGRRKPRSPRLRWLDYVEDDVITLVVRRLRTRAEDHEEWAIILKEELYVKEEEVISVS
jgi:hypothetical protein